MKKLNDLLEEYIAFCTNHKRLDKKTVKAYRIDIRQFVDYLYLNNNKVLCENSLNTYVTLLNSTYKPKTVKRKLASIKVFINFLNDKEYLHDNYQKVFKIKFREPKNLPKTIELHNMKLFFNTLERQKNIVKTEREKECIIRDIAIIELLFSTGMRVSELCFLKKENLDICSGSVRINGKGSKERILSISNPQVICALQEYEKVVHKINDNQHYYFLNNFGNPISDQSVRFMIKKYADMAGISQHITPHMFRHSFATLLLEQDVDIRYIQRMLGHSSITVTEIYTFVSNAKQKDILLHKNPRNLL